MQVSLYTVYIQLSILVPAVEYQWFFLIEDEYFLFESMCAWYTILLGLQNTQIIGKGCKCQIFGYQHL